MRRRELFLSLAAGLLTAANVDHVEATSTQQPHDVNHAISEPEAHASIDGTASTIRFAMVIFPGLTQLDFTGPFEVLARVPGAEVSVVAQTLDAIVSDTGLRILPTHTFETAGLADVLFVPGGPGQNAQMTNPAMLDYLRRVSTQAQWVTSVCTGSLLLAAAGLLDGYRATCHWLSIDQLELFGVTAEHSRVVIDRNRITGAGVTSGIDFAFFMVAKLRDAHLAKLLELLLEYDPKPPYRAGTPQLAGPLMVDNVRKLAAPMLAERRQQSAAAVLALRSTVAPDK
jgi:cyclohexyl-isocyanide hydratase